MTDERPAPDLAGFGELIAELEDTLGDRRLEASPSDILAECLAVAAEMAKHAAHLRDIRSDDPTVRWLGDFALHQAGIVRLIAEALQHGGRAHYKIEFTGRRRGPKRRGREAHETHVRRGFTAAREVQRLANRGWKQEAAVAAVGGWLKISRSELMEWLAIDRKWGPVDPPSIYDRAAESARALFFSGVPLQDALRRAAEAADIPAPDIAALLPSEDDLQRAPTWLRDPDKAGSD